LKIKIGINASRARSGGAVAHLTGLLQEGSPLSLGIEEVHVWTYSELLARLPDKAWLIKHEVPVGARGITSQLWWERFVLPRDLRSSKISILLNVDAGSVCRFLPAVTMSRDMLSYEPGEIERYGLSKARLRLIALRYIQNRAFQHADGVIFLTKYAASVIQRSCGHLGNVAYIPHGVSGIFTDCISGSTFSSSDIRCLYISNCAPYKHQWQVVKALKILHDAGRNVSLDLVGGGEGKAQVRLRNQIQESDPSGKFVRLHGFESKDRLVDYLKNADIFIFASSCENMPNTLVEAMSVGLPVACSNRGPMPEVLQDGGVYFDPEEPDSIVRAVEEIIESPKIRTRLSARSQSLAAQYTWQRCSHETFSYLKQIVSSGN
jgi:glycosyltransferase involved in cell wall biosynthesis